MDQHRTLGPKQFLRPGYRRGNMFSCHKPLGSQTPATRSGHPLGDPLLLPVGPQPLEVDLELEISLVFHGFSPPKGVKYGEKCVDYQW